MLSGRTRLLFLADVVWVSLSGWFLLFSLVIWPPARDASGAPGPATLALVPSFGALSVAVVLVLSAMNDRSRRLELLAAACVVWMVGQIFVVVRASGPAGSASVSAVLTAVAIGLGAVSLRSHDRTSTGVPRVTLARQLLDQWRRLNTRGPDNHG